MAISSTEILFEFIKIGNSLKVIAIEPQTGVEAVVIVPATLPIENAKFQAVQKLKYLLNKK